MTSPEHPQNQYQTIIHCVQAASLFDQYGRSPVPAIQNLRNMIPSLTSVSGPEIRPPRTAQQTLELVTTASKLLAHINIPSYTKGLGSETLSNILRILTELMVQLGFIVRKEKASLIKGLYVIIDPMVTGGRDPITIAQASVRGGASVLQLRDKFREKCESLALALDLQKLCASSGVSLIINDHVDIAAIVDSAGVHVGQTDVPVNQARLVLAPGQVLGRSNRDIEQLIESESMGADHVAFGAIFETNTTGKSLGRAPRGVEQLRIAKNNVRTPLVAIGGINAGNIATVVEAGADAVCLTAAVALAPEPEAAAANLVGIIDKAGGKI